MKLPDPLTLARAVHRMTRRLHPDVTTWLAIEVAAVCAAQVEAYRKIDDAPAWRDAAVRIKLLEITPTGEIRSSSLEARGYTVCRIDDGPRRFHLVRYEGTDSYGFAIARNGEEHFWSIDTSGRVFTW